MPTDANGDSVYKVTLVADDSRGGVAMHHVTVFVDNVAEQGKITLMAEGVDPEQPLIGNKVTAMIDDPDGGVAPVTWQWARSRDGITNFSVIPGATMYSYTPEPADTGRFLRVTATYIDTTREMDDPETGVRDERVQKDDDGDTAAKDATMGDGVQPEAGDYVFRVMATSTNAVRVDPDDDPTQTAAVEFFEASYELTVVENAEVNTIVGGPVLAMGARFLAYDLDATGTNDAAYFIIDEHGQIRVREVAFQNNPLPDGVMDLPDGATAPGMDDPELDFEGTNAFVLIVTATDLNDETRTATARVTVRLSDLNETPYFDQESREAVTGDNSLIMYAESRSNRVAPLAATEPDGDDLRWEVTGADASDFEIRQVADIASDGKDRVELRFKSQPDFEDGKGSGVLNNTLDDNVYEVTVRATETTAVGGGPNVAATLEVMVQVIDADEDGSVELNWLQPEVGTVITASLSDPDRGVTGESWTWYRSKNQKPNRNPGTEVANLTNDWEQITGANTVDYIPQGVNSDADPATDTAVDETSFLLARVTYTDTPGGADRAAVGVSANPVQANVTHADNNSPDFNANEDTRTVAENALIGTDVGRPVVVNRNEDNDILTYQLDNDNNADNGLGTIDDVVGLFSINKATGQITVNGELDWDDNPDRTNPDGKYEVWVRATDPSGEPDGEDSDHIKVIITATDVNEAPRITEPGMAELSIDEVDSSKEDTDVTKFVGLGYGLTDGDPPVMEMLSDNPNLYHRMDDDNVDSATWTISGPDWKLFEYSTPTDGIGRRLHFKKANLPDYEKPQDANRDNVYEVTIVATDNDNDPGMKDVRITVMNVNEAGKLVVTPEQPDDGMPVMAVLTDPDGVESITDIKWASATSTTVTAFEDATLIEGKTTLELRTVQVGNFLWAMVDYRDGYSMENDPVTALDERNDNPGTDPIETRKLVGDAGDVLFHNSDVMEEAVADNAVRVAPGEDDGGGQMPSTEPEPTLMDRMVYENVPSTGYVGMPLEPDMLGTRDMIGGPDGASFVFAEHKDNNIELNFYDMVMVDSDNLATMPDSNDKPGQLAANVVTHFDYESDKNEYIVEVTDPDAVVAMGPVRVTITVMDVNEAPTAPMEQRGGLSVTGRENPMFDEILADDASPDLTVGTYRGIGADAANARWSLSGPDMGKFTIDASTGELTFDAAPDFENPIDADTDNRYQITVEAADGTNTATLPVTVMVVNVGEPGVVTLWRDDSAGMGQDVTTATLRVGDVVTGAQDDPDGGVNNEMWKWYKSDAMDGTFTEITTGMMGDGDKTYTVMEADTDMYLKVMATYDDNVPGSETAYVVSAKVVAMDAPMPDMTLLERYNTDGTPGISKPEYLAAADDFFDDIIDKPTLLEVADLYFDS